MSIECGICERDLRGGHADWCPRPELYRLRNALKEIARPSAEKTNSEYERGWKDAIDHAANIARKALAAPPETEKG